MPYINVKLAGDITRDQKETLVKELTRLMKTVLNKPESATLITIETWPKDNWGRAGELLG